MEPGKDYYFDIEKLELHFINGSTYHTYKILIMINVEYINNLVKEVYKLQ